MFRKLSLLLSISLSVSLPTFGQFYKYSNDFLSIGIGARSLAMGNAQVASVNDVTAAFWNPAGLANINTKYDLGLMHSEYFAGIAKFDYGAIALPLKDQLRRRMITFSLIRFGVDDIPNTLFLIEPDGSINYDNITSFSVADYAVMFSYAQEMPIKDFKVGGTMKIVHRIAGDFASSWGVGVDFGMQYKKKDWILAAFGKDITTTFNAWSFNLTEEEKLVLLENNNAVPQSSTELTAPRLVMGAARTFDIGKKVTLLTELDLDMTTDGKRNVLIAAAPFSFDPHFGVEAGYSKTIYLRAGLGNIQRMTNDVDSSEITTLQPNVGIGLKIRSVSIDYALTNLSNLNTSLYSHVFSLRISPPDVIKPKLRK